MRNVALAICVLLLLQTTVFSQTCLPEGIIFDSQTKIDNFQTNNPGCTVIEGDVWIRGDIDNLNGLNVLTAMRGIFGLIPLT